MMQDSRERMVVVHILLMARNVYDQTALRSAGNGGFAAVFVLFVIFPFSHAVHLRLMQ
ncbi:hypothetical protein SAMN05216317_1059 [Nitrosomonas eutropha]|nr:hypothetical protein SAMN05216317_1059 [Nitrosomonas eutropha]